MKKKKKNKMKKIEKMKRKKEKEKKNACAYFRRSRILSSNGKRRIHHFMTR